MPRPQPSYPGTVWNGSSVTRPDELVERDPDAEDYARISEELEAVQNDLRTYSPVVFKITVANVAGTYDFIVPYKVKVIDVLVIKINDIGGATESVVVKNGTTSITDVIALDLAADKAIFRPTTINDAVQVIEAGGTLRVTAVKTTNCEADVYVTCLKAD